MRLCAWLLPLAALIASEARAADPLAEMEARLPRSLRAMAQPPPDLSRFEADDPRRAQGFLVVLAQRLDAIEGYSRDPAWLAIMGWGSPGETGLTWSSAALEEAAGRYPTSGGKADPRADFAASVALAWSAPDFSCRFPLRARFLSERGLIPAPLPLDTGGCPSFEAWAALDAIEGVELIFTTPSWSDPAATAGHVLLRLRARQDLGVVSPTTERVLSYAVDLSLPENNEWRLFKGLVGIHKGQLLFNEGWEVAHRYNTLEQRDTLIYDLRLSRRELRDLMAQLWVQREAESRIPYYFFSINCARMTYDALRAVLPELRRRPAWFAHPHEVISALMAAGRLTPRGVHRSRRSKALIAEGARERLAEALIPVVGFAALYEARWEPVEVREAALRRFASVARLDALTPARRAALTEYLDALIDIENHALDADLGVFNDALTSGALDAALELRAQLPIQLARREDPFPEGAIKVSGSRRARARAGVNQDLQPVARLRLSVVDEQPGEPRQVDLRRSSRFEFLSSETAIRWDGAEARLDEARLTLLSTANYGTHVRTTEGWLSSRTGFALDLSVQSLPSQGVPFGLWLRVGESLTLAHSDDDTAVLAVGLDLALASFAHQGAGPRGAQGPVGQVDAIRAGVGAWAELALPLSAEGLHPLRLWGRATPSLNLAGPLFELELRASLDLLLSRDRGWMAGPFFQLNSGLVAADGWIGGLSLSY